MPDPIEIQDDEEAMQMFLLTEVVGTGPNGAGILFPGPVEARVVYTNYESVPVTNEIWIHRPPQASRILMVATTDEKTGHSAVLYGREQHPLIQEGRLSAAWDVIEYLEKYQHKYEGRAIRRLFGIGYEEKRA